MGLLFEAWADMARSWRPLSREQLGTLGGNPHFRAPAPDRVDQAQHGEAPTTEHVSVIPWWFWIL